MANVIDTISDYSPPDSSVGVPLLSAIEVQFNALMDETSISDNFFVEGPDTDQFVGPGVSSLLLYPDNVSQGDDFLASPGYRGIVQGTFSFETVINTTKMIFTPSQPMAALTQYTAHLPTVDDANGVTYTGSVKFSWTTGSGSIEVIPSTTSTSVLLLSVPALSAIEDLRVLKTTPKDRSVQHSVDLSRIELEFNKVINGQTVNSNTVSIKAYPTTDHPSASAAVNENIAAKLTVDGKKVLIDI
jgi:hypothetical protein